jgi:hypothetical protein
LIEIDANPLRRLAACQSFLSRKFIHSNMVRRASRRAGIIFKNNAYGFPGTSPYASVCGRAKLLLSRSLIHSYRLSMTNSQSFQVLYRPAFQPST